MALGNQEDFSMHSGDSRTLEVTVRDEADAVVNISAASGADLTWALSKKATDTVDPRGASLVSKTEGSGIAITDGPNGRCDVTLDPADTADLKGDDYYHEMQVILSGDTSTVLYGVVTIKGDLI